MAQLAPSVIQIFLVFFVPESPRFGIVKGKEEKAVRTLAKIHADGNEQDEMIQCEYVEIRVILRLEKEVEANSWAKLIRTTGNRHRLVILITAGFLSQ